MKILVFDDSFVHRTAAQLSLKGHDLTVVGTYDEAQALLVSKTDYDEAKRILPGLLEKAGLPTGFVPYDNNESIPKEDRMKCWVVYQTEALKQATTYPSFDVVMTDLMVPASRQAQGSKGMALVGQEMPIGTTIALLAIKAGVKNVAVVTDKNHHDHPASAAFDCFRDMRSGSSSVNIVCTNNACDLHIDEAAGELVSGDFSESEEGKKKYPYLEGNWGPRKGLSWGKNWGLVLKKLLGEEAD